MDLLLGLLLLYTRTRSRLSRNINCANSKSHRINNVEYVVYLLFVPLGGMLIIIITDMPQCGDRLDIAMERLQEVCTVLDVTARRREDTRIRTQRQNIGAGRRHCPVAANKICCRRREECDRQ